MNLKRILVDMNRILLGLYPRRFQAEFGEEMSLDFERELESIQASKGSPWRGRIEMAAYFLRELLGLSTALRLARKFGSQPQNEGAGRVEPEAAIPSREQLTPEGVTPWWQALLGALPLLLFGLMYFLYAVDRLIDIHFLRISIRYELQVLYLLVIVGLGIGLLKGAPRWSYSYLGMVLYFAWNYDQPIVDRPLYFPFGGGLMVSHWIPLGIMLLVVLIVKRSLDPLLRLFREVWNDWTLLSFTLYAAILPLFTIVFLDGDWGMADLVVGLVFDTLLLGVGAIAYLRTRTILRRALSLQAVIWLITLKGILVADWFGASSLGERDVNLMAIHPWLLFWSVLMFIPGLIGLLRRGVRVLQAS